MSFSVWSCLTLLLGVYSVHGDWNQQYGDYRSTNYVKVVCGNGNSTNEPWNYSYPGLYSYMYSSPAVSESGIVFVPFLKYVPPTDNTSIVLDLQVRAAAPNGSFIWIAHGLGQDKACGSILLTNAVYLSKRQIVVIGWTCAAGFPYYEKHGQLIGINSTTGQVVWRSEKLYDANDLSSLSVSLNVAYVSGGYNCYKDGIPFKPYAMVDNGKPPNRNKEVDSSVKSNISRIYAFSLNDGKMIWTKAYLQVGCTSQTRIFPIDKNKHLVIFATNLPRNVYLGGKLLAYECDTYGSCDEKWLSDVEVCWDSTYAFSDQGVLFGGYGFAGVPDLIFGLDIKTGKKIFSNKGYCGAGVYPSGPAVDEKGDAYYSCGNRVFAVNNKGELLWKTDIDNTTDNTTGYSFYTNHRFPPAIALHPKTSTNILVTMNTNSTHLFVLSASNGSVIGSQSVPVLQGDVGVSEPPFVVGNNVHWIKVRLFSKYYLFSLPLVELFQ